MHRTMRPLFGAILCLWMLSLSMVAIGGQAEDVIDEWITESIDRISEKVRHVASENDDPYFVPNVLLGPVVTKILPRREFYESQLSVLLRDSIYLKLAAGLAHTPMEVVDADILPKAVESSGLGSAARLNVADIASLYSQDEAMRKCLEHLLNIADMVILGRVTLKENQALTVFTILTMEDGQLYLDRAPLSIQSFPPDVFVTIQKSSIQRMMEFAVYTDDEVQQSVEGFVRKFAATWEKGSIDKLMEYYDKNASAVTLTLRERSSVELTNILDRNALELVMMEFFERYSIPDFDFSSPEIYNVKRNSKNVASCSVDFYANITMSDGGTRRMPLLSIYMQLRRNGRTDDWLIYFQRIKEVPKYSIQLRGGS